MRILYLDHYAGSLAHGMEFRPYYLAREWKKKGHDVVIIGGDYSHLRSVQPNVIKDFQEDYIDGIKYEWIRTGKYQGNGIKRAISMLRFVGKVWFNAEKIANSVKPDVIISSSTYPLDTYASQRIRKFSHGILVHEVHDMWPITPIELYGMSKFHPFVVVMQAAENSFCKHADLVVSVLPCAESYLRDHGLGENKFVCIENGVVEDDWINTEALPKCCQDIIDKAKSENRLVIGFYGSHTKAYCLDYLLRAASEIDSSRYFLLFVGDGSYKPELVKLAKQLKLDENSYAFVEPISKRSIPMLIEQIDVSFVGATKNKIFRFGIGMNKLFDALMGGKPILYAVSAPNNLIDKYNCGISVEPENVASIADGLIRLLDLSEIDRQKMGSNGHKAATENYTYSVLAQRFIDSVESIKRKRDVKN